MKKLSKKKMCFCVLSVVLLCIVCFIYFTNKKDDQLSKSQIQELREKYPICGIKVPPLSSMRNITLDEAIKKSESFVYGEVIGDFSTYKVSVSTGYDVLDKKSQANGIPDTTEFYEYPILVIKDSEGIYSEGDQITITANTMFMEYNPTLSKGMKIVVPVIRDPKVTSRNHYGAQGMYYVTEDGYAITAFEENLATKRSRTINGIKVNELLDNLKK